MGSEMWEHLIKGYADLNASYKAHLNLEYRLAIERLKGSDQRIRSRRTLLRKKDYDLFDSLNFQDLLHLFEEQGFPNMKEDGFDWELVDVFMMHYSVESPERFDTVVQIVTQAYEECLCEKSDIALLTDRRKRWVDQADMVYGLWNSFRERGVFGPIEQIETIDQRRFDYNLLRLKEQAQREGRALPDGYTPIPYPDNYFCHFPHQLND